MANHPTANTPRSISNSIVESFKEVKLMREGKKTKTSLDSFFNEIDKLTKQQK